MRVYILIDDFDYKNHVMKYRSVVTLNPQDGFRVAEKVIRARGQSILADWEAPEVKPFWEEPEKPEADISFIGVSGPITVNAKARDALSDLLEQSGELLPLKSKEGEYSIHNVTEVIDAFDLEQGAYHWSRGVENIAMSIPKIFSFKADAIGDRPAFRHTYSKSQMYYTDIFKQRVEEAGLTGVIFQLIWDSEDPNYHDQRYDPEQWERVKRTYPRGPIR
jgi:hypothetical protein